MSFFSTALREAHVHETVIAGGATYKVNQGVVSKSTGRMTPYEEYSALRLAYEKSSARNAPILSLPNIDLDVFRSEVASLNTTASELAARQAQFNNSLIVRKSLYPLGLLARLADLESARRQFLIGGSDRDAALYRILLMSTIETYNHDISSFIEGFQKTVPANTPDYGTPKSIISRGAVLTFLDHRASSLQKAKEVLRARVSCFDGTYEACRTDDLQLPMLSDTPPIRLSVDALSLAKRTRDILTSAGEKFVSPQSIRLTASVCINPEPDTALVFGLANNNDGALSSPVFLGDILLVQSDTYADLPYYKYYAVHHIPYVYMDPLTYYECPRTSIDLGAITTTDDVAAFARQERVSAFAIGDIAEILKGLEETFASSQIITEADAKSYLTLSLRVSKNNTVPETLSNYLRSLWLQMSTKSSGLLLTMHLINNYEHINMRIAPDLAIDFGATYLFFARSGFASLFPDTGISFYEESAAFFPQNELPPESEPYISFSSLPDNSMTAAEVTSSMRFFFDFHPDRP